MEYGFLDGIDGFGVGSSVDVRQVDVASASALYLLLLCLCLLLREVVYNT